MAKRFPERLPESIQQDPDRGAERRVYDALSQLPDSFTIFYSVAWLGRTDAGAQDGEADFVVAHPELGILVLEVKGGGICFDAASGAWSSTNRHGQTFEIKDPAEQARRNKYALLRKLQELPGWGNRWVTLGHAVVLPDVTLPGGPLRPDLPAEILMDHHQLQQMEAAIGRAFAYWQQEDARGQGLGSGGMQLLTNLLGRSFQLRTPLGVALAADEARIVELTEEQMRILDVLSQQRRAAIQGCAGSGKTMLALEKARRLAAEGFQVLLTCFNIALARYLQERAPQGVHVAHFHGLCEELADQAALPLTQPQDDLQTYYDHTLPDYLLDAVDRLGPQFDAIVVDEGQDFKENWWLGLQYLLRDREQGIFYVFFDDNQNLYQGVDHIPGIIDQRPYSLQENCRNTRSIHRLVSRFHPAGTTIRCRGPAGREPEWIPYQSEAEMLRLLRSKLHQLVNEEGIAPGDLVILTPRAERRSALKEGTQLGNFVLTRKPLPRGANQLWVTTIHAFKGLERPVVLLAEIDDRAGHNRETLFYVGCSRARAHLLLFHDRSMDPATLTVTG